MTALTLDEQTWPDDEAALRAGRRTVVVAFGATEQHGPHLPLSVDRLLGEHLSRLVAERLDAFVAPTVPFGCSEHHLAFPGTISASEDTFAAIVGDVVDSLAGAGFTRIVLLPAHGGNFAPLRQRGRRPAGARGRADGRGRTARRRVGDEPDAGRAPRAGAPRAGRARLRTLEEALAGTFQGIEKLSDTGVIGDPARASAAHGERYWALAADLVVEAVGGP